MRLLFVIISTLFSFQAFSSELLYLEAQKKGITLSEEDKKILKTGEISTLRYVTGGILGTYPIGLGIGHAIQGRYDDMGYIFTLGEVVSAGVFIAGVLGCLTRPDTSEGSWKCSDLDSGLIITGGAAYFGFRIWEAIDVWSVPPMHNHKFRSLKEYIEKTEAKPQVKSSLDLVPVYSPDMGQGFGLKFIF